jgi:hypothetical protein
MDVELDNDDPTDNGLNSLATPQETMDDAIAGASAEGLRRIFKPPTCFCKACVVTIVFVFVIAFVVAMLALRATIAEDRGRREGRVRATEAKRDEWKAANLELEAAIAQLAGDADGWRARCTDLADEALRAAGECNGLAAKLGAVRALLTDLEGERYWLAAKGSLLRDDAARMAGKLRRVLAERDCLRGELDVVKASLVDIAREHNGLAVDAPSLQSRMAVAKKERDCLVAERLLLRDDVNQLVDKLARVMSKREGLAEAKAEIRWITGELGVWRARCAKLTGAASRAKNAMRELGGKQRLLGHFGLGRGEANAVAPVMTAAKIKVSWFLVSPSSFGRFFFLPLAIASFSRLSLVPLNKINETNTNES